MCCELEIVNTSVVRGVVIIYKASGEVLQIMVAPNAEVFIGDMENFVHNSVGRVRCVKPGGWHWYHLDHMHWALLEVAHKPAPVREL